MSLQKLLPLSSLLLVCTLFSSPAFSQQDDSSSNSSSQSQDSGTVEGTVVASSRSSFVVKSDNNHFQVFTFDRDTNKPATLAVGSQVRVDSDQADDSGARHATSVTVTGEAQSSGTTGATGARNRNAAPIPPQVRNVENDIKREARRWRLGARAGIALDPELVMFGVHSQMGPVFSRNVYFRPNAEFAWGEITDMVALNLEAVYRFQHARRGAWSPYLGGGPALNFIHQSFKTQASEQRDISFGNFDYETGFNILMGFENRRGTFFEVKTSLYSQPAPVLRLILGKNF